MRSDDNSGTVYTMPTIAMESIPANEDLWKLQTLEAFEKVFGPSHLRDGYQQTADGDSVSESLWIWRCFTLLDDGRLRVVLVDIDSMNTGSGEEIKMKRIRDGIQSRVGTCERCGEYSEGRSKLMIYRLMERFPTSPVARQFFCNRCLRVMRIYAFVGFSLLATLLGSLIVAVLWVRFMLNG